MKGGSAQKTPMKERKQLPTNKEVHKVKKRFRSPVICKDFEDLLRLMKRDRPVLKDIDPSACRVCAGSVDHIGRECPCLDRIPPGAVLGPLYDYVCNGCGKIGENCCSKGAYAVRRRCVCGHGGHWPWERRCPKDWRRPSSIPELPSIQELEEEVMKKKNKVKDECHEEDDDYEDDDYEDDDYEDEYREGYPGYIRYGDRKQKLKYPDLEEDREELLRLMKRIRPVVEDIDPYVCPVCAGTVDHFGRECPCLDRIPPGAELGPQYDKVCIGCGNIGEICCSKGAYAIRMKCCCGYGGHWYWEGRCPKDWRRPSIITQLPSIQELEEEVMKKKNKNKEEDEVMVNVRKDIKYVDEVMVEDDKNSIKEEQSLEKSLQNKEEAEVMVNVGKDIKYVDAVEDDDGEEDDEAKGGDESSKQSRSEKQSRKAMMKLGMKQVTGVTGATIKRTKKNLLFVSNPDVFKNPNSKTYVILGEAHDLSSQWETQAAQQFRMPEMSSVMAKLEISGAGAGAPADEEEEEIDETGAEPRDIDLAMTHAGVSRSKAVNALKTHRGNIVSALMELTA